MEEQQQESKTCVLDAKEFTCPICLSQQCSPVSIPCGHTFCKSCISTALSHSNVCSVCRTPTYTDASTLQTNILISSLLKSVWRKEYNARQQNIGTMTILPRLGVFVADMSHFPGEKLTQYIYEPRYRVLMNNAVNTNGRFLVISSFLLERYNTKKDVQCLPMKLSGPSGVRNAVIGVESSPHDANFVLPSNDSDVITSVLHESAYVTPREPSSTVASQLFPQEALTSLNLIPTPSQLTAQDPHSVYNEDGSLINSPEQRLRRALSGVSADSGNNNNNSSSSSSNNEESSMSLLALSPKQDNYELSASQYLQIALNSTRACREMVVMGSIAMVKSCQSYHDGRLLVQAHVEKAVQQSNLAVDPSRYGLWTAEHRDPECDSNNSVSTTVDSHSNNNQNSQTQLEILALLCIEVEWLTACLRNSFSGTNLFLNVQNIPISPLLSLEEGGVPTKYYERRQLPPQTLPDLLRVSLSEETVDYAHQLAHTTCTIAPIKSQLKDVALYASDPAQKLRFAVLLIQLSIKSKKTEEKQFAKVVVFGLILFALYRYYRTMY